MTVLQPLIALLLAASHLSAAQLLADELRLGSAARIVLRADRACRAYVNLPTSPQTNCNVQLRRSSPSVVLRWRSGVRFAFGCAQTRLFLPNCSISSVGS